MELINPFSPRACEYFITVAKRITSAKFALPLLALTGCYSPNNYYPLQPMIPGARASVSAKDAQLMASNMAISRFFYILDHGKLVDNPVKCELNTNHKMVEDLRVLFGAQFDTADYYYELPEPAAHILEGRAVIHNLIMWRENMGGGGFEIE